MNIEYSSNPSENQIKHSRCSVCKRLFKLNTNVLTLIVSDVRYSSTHKLPEGDWSTLNYPSCDVYNSKIDSIHICLNCLKKDPITSILTFLDKEELFTT